MKLLEDSEGRFKSHWCSTVCIFFADGDGKVSQVSTQAIKKIAGFAGHTLLGKLAKSLWDMFFFQMGRTQRRA